MSRKIAKKFFADESFMRLLFEFDRKNRRVVSGCNC
jgi:hypothetical protein